MKRKITLSIALVVSAVLISLAGFSSTVKAQQQNKIFVADSGAVTLGLYQKLRVIVTTASDNQTIPIKFRRCTFTQQNGIFTVNSSQISPVMMLASNEARFFDIFDEDGVWAVRARVGSRRSDFVVTFQIIDVRTDEIQSHTNGRIQSVDDWETFIAAKKKNERKSNPSRTQGITTDD